MQRRADRSSAVRILACVAADMCVGTSDRQFPCFESNRGSHEHPCSLPFYMCFLWTDTGCQSSALTGTYRLWVDWSWYVHGKNTVRLRGPALVVKFHVHKPPSRAGEQLDTNHEKSASFGVIQTSPVPSFCLRKIPSRSQRDDSMGSLLEDPGSIPSTHVKS